MFYVLLMNMPCPLAGPLAPECIVPVLLQQDHPGFIFIHFALCI
jgi:hypothetical protein